MIGFFGFCVLALMALGVESPPLEGHRWKAQEAQAGVKPASRQYRGKIAGGAAKHAGKAFARTG